MMTNVMIKSGADYSAPLYYGHKQYDILPRRRNYLSFMTPNGRVFTKGPVTIPARKENRWIEKEWTTKEKEILDRMAKAMLKGE